MFDLSFVEMLLAGVVALVVLGPERLPKVARTAGEWVGKVQRLAANVKSELAAQADYAEMTKIKDEVVSAAQEIREEIKDFEQQLQEESQQIGDLIQLEDNRPAWEKLPEQRTPADFGIHTEHDDIPTNKSHSPYIPKLSGIHTPSLRKQAVARQRDRRPRYHPKPKLRSRK